MTITRANMPKQISQPGALKGDPIKKHASIFFKEMKKLTTKKKAKKP